jgi:hypothetical protein
MQVETRIIKTVTARNDVGTVALPVSRTAPEAPWRPLAINKSGTGWDKPTYQRHITQEDLEARDLSYFGKAYNFNTKYVVDAEEHDVIGCVITLASGVHKHIDMTAASVNLMCNRR